MSTLADLERLERDLRSPATVFLDGEIAVAACNAFANIIAAYIAEQKQRDAKIERSWKNRYIGRMVARGFTEEDATACCEAGFDSFNVLDDDPEDAADDEISCMCDDGEPTP